MFADPSRGFASAPPVGALWTVFADPSRGFAPAPLVIALWTIFANQQCYHYVLVITVITIITHTLFTTTHTLFTTIHTLFNIILWPKKHHTLLTISSYLIVSTLKVFIPYLEIIFLFILYWSFLQIFIVYLLLESILYLPFKFHILLNNPAENSSMT